MLGVVFVLFFFFLIGLFQCIWIPMAVVPCSQDGTDSSRQCPGIDWVGVAQPNGQSSPAATPKAAGISLCPTKGPRRPGVYGVHLLRPPALYFQAKKRKKEGKWRKKPTTTQATFSWPCKTQHMPNCTWWRVGVGENKAPEVRPQAGQDWNHVGWDQHCLFFTLKVKKKTKPNQTKKN